MKRSFSALIVLVLPAKAIGTDHAARVIGITDGDTIKILQVAKTQVKSRPNGIDKSEISQAFGSRANQVASELVIGNEVTIRPVGTDRHGRTVAKVTLPYGISLTREAVECGMAFGLPVIRAWRGDLEPGRGLRHEVQDGGIRTWSRPGTGGRARAISHAGGGWELTEPH